jgi:hypothetical protein
MYILLIILFIIFISILYYFNFRNEGFTDNIESNKNIFINNKKKLDIENINIRNICIKDDNGTECISKEQLFNTLNLPIFRKHSICIEDACISHNNLKKILGHNDINLKTVDDKCVESGKISGTLSIRQQARWETDRKGIKFGDLNASKYHSLYEPEDGWVLEKHCGKRKTKAERQELKGAIKTQKKTDKKEQKAEKQELRKEQKADRKTVGKSDKKELKENQKEEKQELRNDKKEDKEALKLSKQMGKYKNTEYDYGRKYIEKESAILNYGCARKHSRTPGVCWASAGGKCKRDRNNRRRLTKAFYKNKLYNLEVDDDDTLYTTNGNEIDGQIPSLKQNEDCTKPNTKYKVGIGDIIGEFENIINPMKGVSYKRGAEHDLDHNRVIQ